MPHRTAPILAVAFDLDGLMFNTEDLYHDVGSELLRRRGKQLTPELLIQMMGRTASVALQIMIECHHLSDTVEQLQQETDEIFDGLLDERLQPLPGLHELLTKLEERAMPRAVTTSSRRRFVERTLRIAGLADAFDFWLTAEDVTEGKPHPEIYRTAAHRFGAPTPQMMVLEDSENGCRAAVSAGAYTVAVPGNHSSAHCFEGVALVAESLHDPRIYDRLENLQK